MPHLIESLLLGVLLLLVWSWMLPGLKAAMLRSRHEPADWSGVLLPLTVVVAFVVLLIAMV